MNLSGTLSLLWTPLGVVAGALMVSSATVICLLAWRRSGWAWSTGLLEGLRWVVVALVAITLNQPEWLTEFVPEQSPTLVVLRDTSRSMETQDVLDSTQPTTAPISRQASVEPWLDPPRWKPLRGKMDVVFESFSSSLPEPTEGTDLHDALNNLLDRHDNLRGVVLWSDGDWNVGKAPAIAASRLRTKNVPVFTIGVGSETRLPDIELVRVDAPTFGVVGKPMRIPYVIESALAKEYAVQVTLTPSVGEPVTADILVPAMGIVEDAITWLPAETGDLELTFDVPAHDDELLAENNRKTVPIAIRQEALKVLLIESFPRWEYRFLRNALLRDPGVDVSCLMFHPGLSKVGGGQGYLSAFPATMEELAKYDVVFLGDVGVGEGQLTVEQCRLIKGLVGSQASGLILMPGFRGNQLSLAGTELDELYPVVLDAAQPRGWGSRIPAQFELTETGRRSLLTKLEDAEDENARLWETMPGFQWYAATLRAKAGTEVLATHKTASTRFGRVPLLVTRTFGTGKILFMGTDAAWRWREGVEDQYHYRFWGQVARWMAYQRSMAQGEMMRLFYSPDRPLANALVTLNANVMSASGAPLENGTVIVQIVAPSGNTQTVRMTATGDEWGLFTGSFTPEEPGNYQLTLSCRENGGRLETTLSVQGVRREKLGRPARFDVLREIATISRGSMVEAEKLDELLQQIADLPEPDPTVRRLRIWCHPLWAGFLVFLLGVFWTGRKMVGTI